MAAKRSPRRSQTPRATNSPVSLRQDPPPAGARRSDPWTSHLAAALVEPTAQRRAYWGIGKVLVAHPGITAEQIDELYRTTPGNPHQDKCARRLSEMAHLGLIFRAGAGKTRYGRPAALWWPAEALLRQYEGGGS